MQLFEIESTYLGGESMYREFVECSLLHKLELHGSKQAPYCNIIVAMQKIEMVMHVREEHVTIDRSAFWLTRGAG